MHARSALQLLTEVSSHRLNVRTPSFWHMGGGRVCMHPMQVAAGAGCGLQMGCMSATGARCCPPAQSSHLNGLNPSLWHRGVGRVCMHPTQVAASAGWGLQTGCMPGSATAQPGTSRHIPTSPGCPNQQYLGKWCVCCWQGWEQCALYCTHLGEPIHAQNTLFCHPSFSHPTHPRTSC